jgi:hypothetical protein
MSVHGIIAPYQLQGLLELFEHPCPHAHAHPHTYTDTHPQLPAHRCLRGKTCCPTHSSSSTALSSLATFASWLRGLGYVWTFLCVLNALNCVSACDSGYVCVCVSVFVCVQEYICGLFVHVQACVHTCIVYVCMCM